MKLLIWLLAITIPVAFAQTKVDLRNQGKTVDFSTADFTKPFRSGTSLPSTCSQGETFLLLPGNPSSNFYACIEANTWSAQGGITYAAGPGVLVVGNTIATEDAIVPRYYTGAGAPTLTCATGRDFYIDTAGSDLYFCKSTNTWSKVLRSGSIGATDIGSGTFADARIATSNVTQHQAALTVNTGQIGSGTLADARIAPSNVTQHQAALTIGAGQIGSGTLADARLAVSNITQHQASLAIGTGQITSGTLPLARGGTNQTTWTSSRCVQVSSDGTKLESASAACGTGGGSGFLTWLIVTPAVGISSATTSSTFIAGGAGTPFSASAGARRTAMPAAGTIANCYLRTSTAQPTGGALTLTIKKNGTATSMAITVPTSSAAGIFSNTSATVTIAAGDELEWEAVNASSAATSASMASIACQVQQ